MNFLGVYDNGIESCFSLIPSLGTWKILATVSTQITLQGGANSYSPKYGPRNPNQTLRTQLRRETPRIIQIFVNQRREVHEVLVCIIQP
jgi:hypothetical protein